MACKWINFCPLRNFERKGILDKRWKEQYCKRHFEGCKRYQMTEKGLPHADNMMPDGSIKEDLEIISKV